MYNKKKTVLVLSGGGIKGIAQIGAIKYLDDSGILKNINYIIGTSVGSIIGLFVCLKLEINDMYGFVKNKNYNKLSLNEFFFDKFILEFGLNDLNKFCDFINYLMKKRLNSNKNITFKDLYEYSGIILEVVTSCISDSSIEYFNYYNSPNMEVWLAIRMSISIPILYTPILYKKKIYVDGGMFNNYAIDLVPSSKIDETIGVTFNTNTNFLITSLDKYLYELLISVNKFQFKKKIDKYKSKTILVDLNINPIEYDIDEKKIKEIFDSGYNTAKDFFNSS